MASDTEPGGAGWEAAFRECMGPGHVTGSSVGCAFREGWVRAIERVAKMLEDRAKEFGQPPPRMSELPMVIGVTFELTMMADAIRALKCRGG